MNAVVSTDAVPAVALPDDADGRRSRFITTVWVAGIAVVAGLALAIVYRGGLVVVYGDPIAYIGVARSLAAGHGVSVPYSSLYTQWHLTAGGPVSHWPPGYSLLLSIWSGSVLLWARILAVALFSACVFLFGFLAQRLGVTRFGAIALAIIFAGTSFQLFGAVLSEPLFFFLVLLGLHGLVSFFRRPTVPSILLASVAFGLATITRYLGEAFVIGGVIAIIFIWREPIARRLRFAAVLAIVGNIPLVIWLSSIHNSPESPALHVASFYDMKTSLYTVAGYIVPGVPSANLRVLIVVAIVIGVIVLMKRGSPGSLSPIRIERTDWLLLILALTYLLFLFAARSLIDPLIQLNTRMLFLAFMLAILWCAQNWPRFASWSAVPRSPYGPPVATAIVCLLVVSAAWNAIDTARHAQQGSYAAATPANSALKAALAAVPKDSVIYSNLPDVTYFVSGRTIHILPLTASPLNLKRNHDFAAQMSSVEQNLCGRPATVVYAPYSKAYLEPPLDVVEHDFNVATVTSVQGWKLLSLDTGTSC
jgi:hypothetical protein